MGNVTSWTTKGKHIWPTATGRYILHHTDGNGSEFPVDPSKVYQNAVSDGGKYPNTKHYWFRISATFSLGESEMSDPSLPTIPDLQVPSPPTGNTYINVIGGNNGYAELSWQPINGAAGYKVWIFNGKDYEPIDVGHKTKWSTKDFGIWPTSTEIANASPGKLMFHKDGKGTDLPTEPFKLYEKMGTAYATSKDFYFRLSAYNGYGETIYSQSYFSKAMSNELKPGLETPELRASDYAIDGNTGYVNLQWDTVTGADGYKIWIFNGKEYQAFDVGNALTWSTKGQGIWLSDQEIQSGLYKLHTDGTGKELALDPNPVYLNANSQSTLDNLYSFKISAYSNNGNNSDLSEAKELNIDWQIDNYNLPDEDVTVTEDGFIAEEFTESCPASVTESECALINLKADIQDAEQKIADIKAITNQTESFAATTVSENGTEYGLEASMFYEINKLEEQIEKEKQNITEEETAVSSLMAITEEDTEDFTEYDYTEEETLENKLLSTDLNVIAVDDQQNSYTLNELHDIVTKSSPLARGATLSGVVFVPYHVNVDRGYDPKKKEYKLMYHVFIEPGANTPYAKPSKFVVKRTACRTNHIKDKPDCYYEDTDTMYYNTAKFDELYISTTKFREYRVKITPYKGKSSYTPIYDKIKLTLYNKKGFVYPKYTNPHSGRKLPVPASTTIGAISQEAQSARRSQWNSIRPTYRTWYENQYKVKPNWKDYWDCHHIIPIKYNGTNNYSNILVMNRDFHQQKVTPWWTNY